MSICLLVVCVFVRFSFAKDVFDQLVNSKILTRWPHHVTMEPLTYLRPWPQLHKRVSVLTCRMLTATQPRLLTKRHSSSAKMLAPSSSYLIVGSGVFGATTALELKRQFPAVQVSLLDRADFPNPSAASHDVNKIIRADYGDLLYMKLALEAQALWRNDPIYRPYYHETGMLYAENKGMGKSFIDNYKKIGFQHASEFMSSSDAKKRFPAFKHANWTGVTETYYNPNSGWGDGAGALRSVIQAAIDCGVEYKVAPISRLSFNES